MNIELVVDRFEGTDAVLIAEDGSQFVVPLAQLPEGTRPTVVLLVKVLPDGSPDWDRAEISELRTAKRREEAEEILRRLKGRR